MEDGIFATSVEEIAGVAVVKSTGEVDVSTAEQFRTSLFEATASKSVVVDLSGVTFIDSSGLSALVMAQSRFQESHDGEQLKLVVSKPQILKVLQVTGLNEAFHMFDTVEGALK